MKLTIEIPDALAIATKQRAAAQRRKIKALVEEGLRMVLQKPDSEPSASRHVSWVVSEGPALTETPDREKVAEWLERPV